MARYIGRDMTVWRNASSSTPEKIAAIRTKSGTINREPIDVTTDDDAGWRTLLTEPGQKQVDLSFSGLTEDEVLIAAIMAEEPLGFDDVELRLASGGTLSGDFFFVSLSFSGEYNGAVTFDGELQSSGEIAYAAAP